MTFSENFVLFYFIPVVYLYDQKATRCCHICYHFYSIEMEAWEKVFTHDPIASN